MSDRLLDINRAKDGIWKLQGGGLIVVTAMTFFPRLSHLQEYLFFTLLFLAIAVAWHDKQNVWVRTPIDVPLALLVIWILLTIPFAIDPSYSFAEWRKLVANLLVFYWALLVFRRFGSAQVSRSQETVGSRLGPLQTPLVKGFLVAIVCSTAVLSTYAITDFVVRGGMWEHREVMARPPSSSSQWLGTYLVIALPILLSVTRALDRYWLRVALALPILVALVALVCSYSRGAWLAVLVECVVFVFLTGRRRLTVFLIGAGLLASIALVLVLRTGYQHHTLDPETLGVRVSLWNLGVRELADHPLVGIGYGEYTFIKRFGPMFDGLEDPPLYATFLSTHNTFLMVALGSGVPALVFLTWALVGAASSLVRGARLMADTHARPILIATAVMIAGFAARIFFDHMFMGSLASLFLIVMANGLTLSMSCQSAGVVPRAETQALCSGIPVQRSSNR